MLVISVQGVLAHRILKTIFHTDYLFLRRRRKTLKGRLKNFVEQSCTLRRDRATYTMFFVVLPVVMVEHKAILYLEFDSVLFKPTMRTPLFLSRSSTPLYITRLALCQITRKHSTSFERSHTSLRL